MRETDSRPFQQGEVTVTLREGSLTALIITRQHFVSPGRTLSSWPQGGHTF